MSRWVYRLYLGDVFRDEARTFEERRDEIVRRIRETEFRNLWGLTTVVDELATAEDTAAFDQVWSQFYDLADHHRIWVVTWREPLGVTS